MCRKNPKYVNLYFPPGGATNWNSIDQIKASPVKELHVAKISYLIRRFKKNPTFEFQVKNHDKKTKD